MNKKITAGGTALIIIGILLIIVIPTGNSQPMSHQNAQAASPSLAGGNNQIIQGKITPNGDLFIILEQVPMTNQYEPIPAIANNPNFQLLIYSPNGGNITLQEQVGKEAAKNMTVQTTARQITEYDFTLALTNVQASFNLSIQGIGYFNIPERLITPSPIPFYNLGQLSEFAFLTIITALIMIISFSGALAIIHRAKYFPPISAAKMTIISLATVGIITYQYSTNYYAVIQEPWYYLEIPLILLTMLIFLTYIPQQTQRGILIRFLDERSKEEVYTDILPILSAETEPPAKIPLGWRSSNMEYIDGKSYYAFLRRLAGLHTHIIFKEGALPDQLARPQVIQQEKRRMNKFIRMKNRKRTARAYDYGYLLAGKTPNGTQEEISEERIEVFPERKILRKKRFLKIPLSGHHSTYVEQFLAGLADARLEGDRIETMKEQLASKEAQILSGTYLNDTMIISKLGEILGITEKPKKQEEPKEIESKEEGKDEQN